MKTRTRVAVVGLGVIGAVHVRILRNLGYEIAAVCDVDTSRFDAYPEYAHYTDYNAMLTDLRPDSVHICTPHYLHAEMVVAALNMGINVLCEKPLCISALEIEEILKAERNSTAILGVVHQNRYVPANTYVKEYLKDKKVLCGTGFVAWHRDEKYYDSAEWRGKWKTEGGGVLINQALHTLDLLQWYVGFPEYAAAVLGNLSLADAVEVEDTASVICSGKADFSFFATNASVKDFDVEVTLKTDNETIRIQPNCAVIDGEFKKFDSRTQVYAKKCYGSGHENLIADFYDCIADGKKFWIDGEEGAKVIRLILAAYKSEGKRVRV